MMSKRGKAKKFEPVEVFLVVFICLFAIAIIGSAAQMSRFEAYRIECTNNLSRIGRAILIYADDYEEELPRAGGRNSVWAPTIPDWGADNRFNAYGIPPDGYGGQASISSCFYLLVKYAEVATGAFVCRGDVGTTAFKLADVNAGDKELVDLWDFGPEPRKHCSYAYHMPFNIYAPKKSSEPSLPIAADRNPWIDSPAAPAKQFPGIYNPEGSRESVRYGNSLAHKEEGQNVLFLDGHVAFEDRSFCGIHEDNIYTSWDGGDIRVGSPPTIISMSQDRRDSFLVHDPTPSETIKITKEPEPINSDDLNKISIVATLDYPSPEHKNVIWCSTFQMTWDKLKNDIIGESVKIPQAAKLASRLNQAEFSPNNIENESFYATSGFLEEGIIAQIQKEMTQRFPSEPAPIFDGIDELPLETIIAYSYLNAGIEFKYPFYTTKVDFRDSNDTITKVKSFCISWERLSSYLVRDQVDVLYYKKGGQGIETEFAVDLCKYTNPYQVVLACVPQQKTLGKTVAFVEQKITEFRQKPDYEQQRKLLPSSGIRPPDHLIVPDVFFLLTHNFADLEGKSLGNQQWLDKGYFIWKAMQTINFTLGRTGVILKSEARMILIPALKIPEPRRFYFNKPFLIYIKKRGSDYSPFFVMWVDNAELMQEFVPGN